MNRIPVIILCLTLGLLCTTTAHGYPSAKVTAKAVDEQGNPISGANVSISFMKAKEREWGMTTYDKDGKSDNDGLYSASGEGTQSVSIFVTKDGYYPSGDGVKLTSSSFLLNRWEPWNPTIEVVLKKKRNPVPMIIKGTDWVIVPKLDTPVGFDLEKGDWVAPYGNGTVSDFVFKFQSNIKAYREYDLAMQLNFSNALDGIQEWEVSRKEQSYFKWPYEAPTDGYKGSLTRKIHKIPGKTETNINRDAKYIFRVRTKVDDKGRIISAKYGKVSSEFELSPEGSNCMIRFFYYFNPDTTRNLEEDPEKNLFKNK